MGSRNFCASVSPHRCPLTVGLPRGVLGSHKEARPKVPPSRPADQEPPLHPRGFCSIQMPIVLAHPSTPTPGSNWSWRRSRALPAHCRGQRTGWVQEVPQGHPTWAGPLGSHSEGSKVVPSWRALEGSQMERPSFQLLGARFWKPSWVGATGGGGAVVALAPSSCPTHHWGAIC